MDTPSNLWTMLNTRLLCVCMQKHVIIMWQSCDSHLTTSPFASVMKFSKVLTLKRDQQAVWKNYTQAAEGERTHNISERKIEFRVWQNFEYDNSVMPGLLPWFSCSPEGRGLLSWLQCSTLITTCLHVSAEILNDCCHGYLYHCQWDTDDANNLVCTLGKENK